MAAKVQQQQQQRSWNKVPIEFAAPKAALCFLSRSLSLLFSFFQANHWPAASQMFLAKFGSKPKEAKEEQQKWRQIETHEPLGAHLELLSFFY